ncbi:MULTISPECIES: LPS export ABC transporter periplasmic protein LptC [Maricaulis]|uniref:LPS export ABC transporter periplasmic protein LptC n=1 Tax=Maricaulis TaxID=74317 RepID=UPI00094891E8|nr:MULTISPECIES: LPS export ABC transporter periplasmic protein LptC [Maricaulis]
MTAPSGFQPQQSNAYARWEPRRALALSVARRRTAFVRGLRLFFTAGALTITGLLVVQLVLGSSGAAVGETESVSTDVRMTNPRFTGRDENLTPYAVTADVAIRRRDAADGVTELERPRLDYNFLEAGTDVSQVLAESGRYDLPNRILDLYSDVNFRTRAGYRFQSNHARIFLRDERVTGEEAVEGTGPMGTIRADSYEISDGGNHIIFSGNVRARLVQDRTAPDTTAPPEEGNQ